MSLPKVVLLRGYSANPWDLRPWGDLADSFDVSCVVTKSNVFDCSDLPITTVKLKCTRDFFPKGQAGGIAAYAAGERYFGLEQVLADADIVHGAELGTWFTGQATGLKEKLGFKLAVTVWETIPFLATYRRYRPTRRYRKSVLAAADIFLPTTERAANALLLEGVPTERIELCPPGIDRAHFAAARKAKNGSEDKLILSPGRLVWEKGHQDVLRAFAALIKDIVPIDSDTLRDARLLIVGSGPEKSRINAYAKELGIADRVEIGRSVPYNRMPDLYAQASCMVLASLPIPNWEEQFGMVLAEGMASGVPILAARSGAIPEVLAGQGRLFDPGDWFALAELLAEMLKLDGTADYSEERTQLFSSLAATERLRSIYRRVLGG